MPEDREPIRIPVQRIEEGMVLADDAVAPPGTVLLGRGTRLTARHIPQLLDRGIAEVLVERPDRPAEAAEELAPAQEKFPPGPVQDRLDALFEHKRGERHMDTIYQLARERAGRIAQHAHRSRPAGGERAP